eukprot:jgi/Tetstr1/448902/TSEL_036128.t1
MSGLSKSLVPLGVADDRYRTGVCQGNEDAATYSRLGLAFLLPALVDHEYKARRRKHETARTMAAAKEMRHWNQEAHIGDDYILADVKAAVAEAARLTSKRCGG